MMMCCIACEAKLSMSDDVDDVDQVVIDAGWIPMEGSVFACSDECILTQYEGMEINEDSGKVYT